MHLGGAEALDGFVRVRVAGKESPLFVVCVPLLNTGTSHPLNNSWLLFITALPQYTLR